MVDMHHVDSVDDARNYIARLDQIPRKFGQVLEGLRLRDAKGMLPPRFAVEKSLLQLGAFNARPVRENPLYVDLRTKLDKLPPGEMSAALRDELLAQAERSLAERVLPAYRMLTDHVAALLANLDLDKSFLIGAHHGLTDKMVDYIFEIFSKFIKKL